MPNESLIKILIIDNEKAISNVLSLKLKFFGFDAEIVKSGEEAMNLLTKNQYSLIILELILPGISGFNVLADYKSKKGSQAPVIVYSNLGLDIDVEKAEKLGADKYFKKSETTVADLADYIKQLT
jgi:DNA-binding response OmpR family regulator